MAEKKPIAILKEYFGLLPGQKTLDFAKEVKELSDEEKMELAEAAAAELGYTVAT